MDALRDHPQVLYGAISAFVIVILLTPAVGGMARLLGVVDRPEARRLNPNPIPRLGGIAIFFGIFVPALAFLELGRETRGVLLGAAVATVVGAIDDFRVLAPGRKLAGQIVAAAIPPFFGVWIDHFTFPFLGPVDPDAEERRDRGRDHLAGELPARLEDAEVVDRAHDRGDGGAEEDATRLGAELEEGERRHEDPEEDRDPAESRDRVLVQPPRLRAVDDPKQARHPADRGREQDHDHEGGDRAVENLWMVAQRVHRPLYFVP